MECLSHVTEMNVTGWELAQYLIAGFIRKVILDIGDVEWWAWAFASGGAALATVFVYSRWFPSHDPHNDYGRTSSRVAMFAYGVLASSFICGILRGPDFFAA